MGVLVDSLSVDQLVDTRVPSFGSVCSESWCYEPLHMSLWVWLLSKGGMQEPTPGPGR